MAQSIPIPAPEQSPGWPPSLWGHVELQLLKFLDRGKGGGWLTAPQKSPSEVVEQLAAAGSIRSKACTRCSGRKKIGMLPCEGCHGSGQILTTEAPVYTATTICRACKGSGRYRRKGVFLDGFGFIKNSNYNCRPEEMGICVTCRGKQCLDGCDAAPHATDTSYTPSFEPLDVEKLHPAKLALAALEPSHQLIFEIAFGPIGRDSQRLVGKRLLALWPMTAAGRRLIMLAPSRRRAHG